MPDLPFDAVVIDNGAAKRRMSAAEFMRLPLPDRIQVILERRIEFIKGELPIARTIALQSLMGPPRS